ncbi:MAG: hypothetical protein ACRDBG_23500 [Waterburya sp.]
MRVHPWTDESIPGMVDAYYISPIPRFAPGMATDEALAQYIKEATECRHTIRGFLVTESDYKQLKGLCKSQPHLYGETKILIGTYET